MARVLAIDFGQKRVGIAVTDPDQIIASGLTTIRSFEIFDFLREYFNKEEVECVIIGEAVQMNNKPADSMKLINPFIKKFEKTFPDIPLHRIDERFTSLLAKDTILRSGVNRKTRQNKALIDKVSATIILQSYLEQNITL
ncbi:MAG TPA: Holliday junction resolvase RuvX [Flavobacteriales bacterium]|nr:Holliday junction resolvase RuvX [Flavobacteriales bacterium]